MARQRRFTVYDALDANGYFSGNPANADSTAADGRSLYAGPVEFPKMLYHPTGDRKITVEAEIIVTPLGPKAVGQQMELVSVIVADAAEEARYIADGWHTTPRASLAAAGLAEPEVSAESRLADANATIARMQLEVQQLKAQGLAAAQPVGARVVRTTSAPLASPPA